jgi:drug/metabolite transporter (DMT)-like permease
MPAVVEPTKEAREAPKPRKGWFFNPYLQIVFCMILSAAAQLFLKLSGDHISQQILFGLAGPGSLWTWAGIACLITSLFSWLYGLRFVPLNIAFNFSGLVHVLVPLSAWLFLGEHISPIRALGILLVFSGVIVVAGPLMRVEEKL